MGYFDNTRKPVGFGGKLMVKGMNMGHAKISRYGFSLVSVSANAKVLDVGCCGGANVATWLKKCNEGYVVGLDYSEISVKATKKYNAAAVKKGKCEVIQGDVSSIPFDDNSFDYISAFETIYFWPGLEKCFKEVYRVLKNGGSFLICNESDGNNPSHEKRTKIIEGMKIYNKDEICLALKEAGFTNFEVHSEEKKHWLCIITKK